MRINEILRATKMLVGNNEKFKNLNIFFKYYLSNNKIAYNV